MGPVYRASLRYSSATVPLSLRYCSARTDAANISAATTDAMSGNTRVGDQRVRSYLSGCDIRGRKSKLKILKCANSRATPGVTSHCVSLPSLRVKETTWDRSRECISRSIQGNKPRAVILIVSWVLIQVYQRNKSTHRKRGEDLYFFSSALPILFIWFFEPENKLNKVKTFIWSSTRT